MRVLLAYDGSNGATQAADIVASAAWPEDSLIRVVSVIQPVVMPMHRPWADDAIDAAITARAGDRNAEVVRRLKGSQLSVEGAVLRGRSATVMIDEARTFAADLIVMGSRGQGQIAALLPSSSPAASANTPVRSGIGSWNAWPSSASAMSPAPMFARTWCLASRMVDRRFSGSRPARMW